MDVLKTNSLFSLESYRWRDLFDGCEFPWQALERIADYLKMKRLTGIEVEVPKGVILEKSEWIFIEKGTRIEAGACIVGPCLIGAGCTIRHGAYLRENVILGERCVIGHSTEVRGSIFLDGVRAAHFNYVGDSILGNGVNLGAGAVCANLRLDRKEVCIKTKGVFVNTHLKKLGAIMGDGVQIGCNCVTNPGTLMGQGVVCHPCLNVGGYVPVGSVVRSCHLPIIEREK